MAEISDERYEDTWGVALTALHRHAILRILPRIASTISKKRMI